MVPPSPTCGTDSKARKWTRFRYRKSGRHEKNIFRWALRGTEIASIFWTQNRYRILGAAEPVCGLRISPAVGQRWNQFSTVAEDRHLGRLRPDWHMFLPPSRRKLFHEIFCPTLTASGRSTSSSVSRPFEQSRAKEKLSALVIGNTARTCNHVQHGIGGSLTFFATAGRPRFWHRFFNLMFRARETKIIILSASPATTIPITLARHGW